MKPDVWQRITSLYEQAVELADADREAFLAQLDEDPEVIDELRRLLASDPPSRFIEPVSAALDFDRLTSSVAPGTKVDDLIIESELGRGGMGVVYAARQESLGRRVALKILPLVKRGRAEHVERFRREARSASGLEHPHVVPIIDFGETEEAVWYSMRLVDGHDLSSEIAAQREARHTGRSPDRESRAEAGEPLLVLFDDPLYISQLTQRFVELADGVHHAHERGVVHRDIKPRNILVDRAGKLYLTDFGLAKDRRFGTMTDTGGMLGTPSYMSPEQARAQRQRVDHRTDVYSLGVVLYELLTLRRPHLGRTAPEVMTQILEQTPPPIGRLNPRVPRALALVCAKAMEKRPKDRYPTAREFADDLDRFLRHEAVMAGPPSILRRVARWVVKNRTLLIAAAIVVSGSLVGHWVSEQRRRGAELERVSTRAGALLELDDWSGAMDELADVRAEMLALETTAGVPVLESFRRRLQDHRRLALEKAQESIAYGMGGDESPFAPHVSPLRPEEITAGTALLQALERIFPEDSEIRSMADPFRFLPRVFLEGALVEAGEVSAAEGSAYGYLSKVDFFRDEVEEPLALGLLPIDSLPLTPGTYRFLVVVPEWGYAELVRAVQYRAEPYRLTARVHRAESAHEGMVFVAGADVSLIPQDHVGCLRTADRSKAVSSFWLDRAEVSNGSYHDYLQDSGRQAPRSWEVLGYDGAQASLAGSLEAVTRWRSLPVVGVSLEEARAYAEWHGKRLPLHTELELAFQGADAETADWGVGASVDAAGAPLANVLGPSASSYPIQDPKAGYALYRESVMPVDHPAFRQGPYALFHAHGNVAEMTESLLTEPVLNRLEVLAGKAISVGSYFGATADGLGLMTHGQVGIEDHYYRIQTGFRTATGVHPEKESR